MAKTSLPVITITTASPLTAAQLKVVTEQLTAKVGPAELSQVVDATVLGGLKLTLGSQEFDATISGKLEKMESLLPEARVTTVVELTAAQRKTLLAALEAKYGAVKLVEIIDPSVLGGIKLLVASTEIDATIQGKVLRLKEQIISRL